MIARFALVILLFGLFGDTGSEHGRTGNGFYDQGQYADAERAYREGLQVHEDTTGRVYASLQNNLGSALHRQERFADARVAFRRAARAAPTMEGQVRALYNAATAAAALGNVAAALSDYEQVLRLDPSHDPARYNYEYLKRNRAKETSGPQPRDVEPSPYARELKKRADRLVDDQNYAAALEVMNEGLQNDSTVRAYRDFMGRLDKIVRIAETP